MRHWLWLVLIADGFLQAEAIGRDSVQLIRKEKLLMTSTGHIGAEAQAHRVGHASIQKRLERSAGLPRVAVMVLAQSTSSAKWHDAFAVVSYSARKAFETSRFAMDLLAVTGESMDDTERKLLEGMGFQVLFKPDPVPVASVRQKYAQKMLSDGKASGGKLSEVSEMMKLYGVGLVDYHRVVICDADLMFLGSLDELLGRSDELMQATYDHELDFKSQAGFTNSITSIPLVNGGFVVVKPSREDFDGLLNLIKEGDFRAGSGWKGERVGWGFGGIGPQGLYSYYYNKDSLAAGEVMVKAPDLGQNMTLRPPKSRVQPLDRSVYDVIDTPDLDEALQAERVSSDDVKVFHFTGMCSKPWDCLHARSAICQKMTDRWWNLRSEFAAHQGSSPPPRCKEGGEYEPMSPSMLLQVN